MSTDVDGIVDRTHWTFGGLVEIQERGSGTQIERRVPGPMGPIATLRHRADGVTTVYHHGDGRANRAFTNDAGQIVQLETYSNYGDATSLVSSPDPMWSTDDLWNGGDDIPELGVVLLGPRAYDPQLGRFLQRDPISITTRASTANPYAFAFSDPVNYADPSGLSPLGNIWRATAEGMGRKSSNVLTNGSTRGTLLGNVVYNLATNLGRPSRSHAPGAFGANRVRANFNVGLPAGTFTQGSRGCGWACRASAVGDAIAGQQTRIIGAVKVAGGYGMAQAGAAVTLVPGAEVLGVAMVVRGADVAASGACELVTNRVCQTFTNRVLSYVADESTANVIEAGIDGASMGGGAAALRMRVGSRSPATAAQSTRNASAPSLVDQLSAWAAKPDRGGLTYAGRALQKHGSRPGSAFPAAKGNPAQINAQGQQVVDEILRSPGVTITYRHHARFGQVIEVRAVDRRGLRFESGILRGFLEP